MKNPRPGNRVTYITLHGEYEIGIIKSVCDDPDFVFVVYKCNEDWDNYSDYTGVRTHISSLVKEWRQ